MLYRLIVLFVEVEAFYNDLFAFVRLILDLVFHQLQDRQQIVVLRQVPNYKINFVFIFIDP